MKSAHSYPIWIRLSGCRVVMVGGGEVAERRIGILRSVGADLTVVSPLLTPGLKSLARLGGIEWVSRAYCRGDLSGAVLAFAATNDPDVNRQIAQDAGTDRIWVNVSTDPSISTFHLPALFSRGEIQVAISTGGKSPALAAQLKKKLSSALDPAYGVLSELLGEVRSFLKGLGVDQKTRAERLRTLVSRSESDLLELIREVLLLPEGERDWTGVNTHIRRVIGAPHFSYAGGEIIRETNKDAKREEEGSIREGEDDLEEGRGGGEEQGGADLR